MKRDTIFYTFFQRSPTLLFDLIPNSPSNPEGYRFDSVAVKEPKFEIDGVFLPPEGALGPVYFCEVQMQTDEFLYERIFAETAQYFLNKPNHLRSWPLRNEERLTNPTLLRVWGWPTPRLFEVVPRRAFILCAKRPVEVRVVPKPCIQCCGELLLVRVCFEIFF